MDTVLTPISVHRTAGTGRVRVLDLPKLAPHCRPSKASLNDRSGAGSSEIRTSLASLKRPKLANVRPAGAYRLRGRPGVRVEPTLVVLGQPERLTQHNACRLHLVGLAWRGLASPALSARARFLMSFPTPRAGQAFMEKLLLFVMKCGVRYLVSHEMHWGRD
jgi:hypothetical protein